MASWPRSSTASGADEEGNALERALGPSFTSRLMSTENVVIEWLSVKLSNGSIPIIWSTGHPVGYWAHDLGPRLGGSNGGRPAEGDAARELRVGQTLAFDGFFVWERPDGTTKTISVEEMAVITEDGAERLIPPQEEWTLVGGG